MIETNVITLAVISPRIIIRSFWNFEHLFDMVIRPCVAKNQNFVKTPFSFLIKTVYFTQKWNFFIRVDILIFCQYLSSVLHNSTQKTPKIRHFSQRYMINVTWFAFFFILTRLQHSEFFIRVILWSNFNWWTYSDCSITLHLYHILIAYVYFHKKLQVIVWYRFDWYNKKWKIYVREFAIEKDRILFISKLSGSEHGKTETSGNNQNYH